MSGDEAPSTLNPSMVPFWLGDFLTWDTNDMGRWGKALRLTVTIDLTKPLKRGTLVRGRDEQLLKVFFRYERLLDFCYVCGKLGHAIKDCNSDNHDDLDDEQHLTYGPWLRASPTKVIETNLNKSGDGVRRMLFKPDAVVVGGDVAIVGCAKAVSDGVVVTDGDKPVADGGGSISVKSDEVLQAQNCIIDELAQLMDTSKWAPGDVVDVENTKVGPKPIAKSSFDKGKAIIISPMVSHLTVPGLRCSTGPSSPIDYPNSIELTCTSLKKPVLRTKRKTKGANVAGSSSIAANPSSSKFVTHDTLVEVEVVAETQGFSYCGQKRSFSDVHDLSEEAEVVKQPRLSP
ncbi:cysteine desulfurase mitochondrial-like [Senna tora]|uniref:Cysteine desulfurase mitochondrial-like n=1 Tax=Senna tora TaxID=362788 RepID=A0A834WZ95_9FABA|nr:cysteine desulfurase mitochondrial-like [Senna tora]